MMDRDTEEHYTRGLVAGQRRLFYLSQRAAADHMVTADDLAMFYGEIGLSRLEAYYSGIRDILSEVLGSITELEGDDGDLEVARWERWVSAIHPAVLWLIGFVLVVAVLYWRGPEL